MPIVTLSGKNQLTLPVDIVRRLELAPGDKLAAELVDDHVVLMPRPDSWAEHGMGIAEGVYGSTKEQIDEYIDGERASPERWEWRQRFYDLLATDSNAWAVVEALKSYPRCTTDPNNLLKHPLVRKGRLDARDVRDALGKLVAHGGARRIPLDGATTEVYRLVREFAEE